MGNGRDRWLLFLQRLFEIESVKKKVRPPTISEPRLRAMCRQYEINGSPYDDIRI